MLAPIQDDPPSARTQWSNLVGARREQWFHMGRDEPIPVRTELWFSRIEPSAAQDPDAYRSDVPPEFREGTGGLSGLAESLAQVGQPAPACSFHDLASGELGLAELPRLEALAAELEARDDVVILCVNRADSRETIAALREKLDLARIVTGKLGGLSCANQPPWLPTTNSVPTATPTRSTRLSCASSLARPTSRSSA